MLNLKYHYDCFPHRHRGEGTCSCRTYPVTVFHVVSSNMSFYDHRVLVLQMASDHLHDTGKAARKQSALAAPPQLQGPVMLGDLYLFHGTGNTQRERVAKVIVQGHVLAGPGTVLAEGQVIGDCFYAPDFWPPLTNDPLAAGTRDMVVLYKSAPPRACVGKILFSVTVVPNARPLLLQFSNPQRQFNGGAATLRWHSYC